jgi:uncharacterized phage protein (TIGR01671 family)
MNREILFRGKTEKGEWVYGVYYKQDHYYNEEVEKHCIITSTDTLGNDMDLDFCEVIPETVGQFTGLTDKNGKKIFEGDILQFCQNPDYKKQVGFGEGAFGLCYDNGECVSAFSDSEYYEDTKEYEVIGNIYDNPELLDGIK